MPDIINATALLLIVLQLADGGIVAAGTIYMKWEVDFIIRRLHGKRTVARLHMAYDHVRQWFGQRLVPRAWLALSLAAKRCGARPGPQKILSLAGSSLVGKVSSLLLVRGGGFGSFFGGPVAVVAGSLCFFFLNSSCLGLTSRFCWDGATSFPAVCSLLWIACGVVTYETRLL